MKSQEDEGLLSAKVRNIRLRLVATSIKPNSVVLDLACGAGYLKLFLPSTCRYFGVDRMLPEELRSKPNYIALDLLSHNTPQRIQEKFQIEPDYITCVAFLEHISDPVEFLFRFRNLFNRQGTLIGTTPHPIGKRVHNVFASAGLLSREAAQEHEAFLDKRKLLEAASGSGGRLTEYKKFLFGLNQLFVIEYR